MISKTIRFFKEYYISPGLYKNKYDYPTHINFPVTDNCNSMCQMCNVWKDKSYNELTPQQIRKIFNDKLFHGVLHVGLSGGEPTLRKDLSKITKIIFQTLPKLKSISITSHGFHPKKWQEIAPIIKQQASIYGVSFKVNISVDGIGDLHEEVRRIKGGWKKVTQTIDILKDHNVPIQIQCTVSKHNIFGVNEVLAFAKNKKIEVIFRKATEIKRLYNKKILDDFVTISQENSFFSDFISSEELMSATDNPSRRLFYKDLSKRLVLNTDRKAPCHFQNNGVLLSAHGELFHCSIDEKPLGNALETSAEKIYFAPKSLKSRQQLINDICPNCIHDQSGAWHPLKLILEVLKNKGISYRKLTVLALFFLKNIKVFFWTPSIKNASADPSPTVHVIGAYGGEHVGDSAILGGVLLRIKKRHPHISKAIVYSVRPDRTRFWNSGLDGINLDIEVKPYVHNFILHSKEDFLVWAGGPIMEMPKDILNHYYTTRIFSKAKLKFEIIGCGWGPFKTLYAKRLAHKIIDAADYVELRQKANLKNPYQLLKDPAFDYIEHFLKLNKQLEWTFSKSKIDEFFSKNMDNGKKNVFINLRPIWNKYNKSKYSTSEIETMIIESLTKLIKENDFNFITLPFNTDHYGFSDVLISLRLRDALTKHQDRISVFGRELNAREMIYFLQKFDCGVSMRFHACIFAKSLRIPVYGLDYTAGEKGKVGHLFDSFNDNNYGNILSIKTDSISAFIKKH